MQLSFKLILSSTLLHSSTNELEAINKLLPEVEDWKKKEERQKNKEQRRRKVKTGRREKFIVQSQ